ncbi:MAG: DNA/RNA non-specific endonuclease [Acidobacteriota bacterium]
MSTVEEKLARLRRFNDWVQGNDKELREESADLVNLEVMEAPTSPEIVEQAINEESIVLRRQRPVLSILNNETRMVFIDQADSEIWAARLTKAKPLLDGAIRAVGRIELQGGRLDWVGTGWLVADNLLVTNRHVANEFALRKGKGLSFRMGNDGPISAAVDFIQEIDNANQLVFKIVKPLHIEEEPGPDLSFFEVEVTSGDTRLAKPIELSTEVVVTENVATIGYPAYDSRIPEPDLMEHIFGRIYNKKRLAPGGITRVEPTRLLHNCTTLGGNSGSVVFDLDSGKAVGLHFSGSFLATNYAVRSDVVKKLLANVRAGRTRPETPSGRKPSAVVPRVKTGKAVHDLGTASVTIPLTVTVSLGRADARPIAPPRYRVPPAVSDVDVEIGEEGVAADYRDREGYHAGFLGDGAAVELPSVDRDADDVLEITSDGQSDTVLRYEHYSVVLSRSRRMCFFSAVNIDGNLSKKTPRVGWKWDPRLPKTQQIMNECYGAPPKFSRGHMTRREDPAWGNTKTAKRGNEDSMHVTNTTPQMQAFNAPIWLALEDYALSHAREDDMKISVFTGPYFDDGDPTMYGVRIPLAFWKIIAFIHDETGELCATGYEMNQEKSLQPEEEFVFGAFTSPQLGVATQVSIRSIEERSGITFGELSAVDPLTGDEESVDDGRPSAPLGMLEQIRFVR